MIRDCDESDVGTYFIKVRVSCTNWEICSNTLHLEVLKGKIVTLHTIQLILWIILFVFRNNGIHLTYTECATGDFFLLLKIKDIPSSEEHLLNLPLFLLICFSKQSFFLQIKKENDSADFLNALSSQIKLFQIRSRSNIIAINLSLIFDDHFARTNVTNGAQHESLFIPVSPC